METLLFQKLLFVLLKTGYYFPKISVPTHVTYQWNFSHFDLIHCQIIQISTTCTVYNLQYYPTSFHGAKRVKISHDICTLQRQYGCFHWSPLIPPNLINWITVPLYILLIILWQTHKNIHRYYTLNCLISIFLLCNSAK